MIKNRLFLLLFVSTVLIGGCKKALLPQDAEKQLKAFDNELIILSKQVSETQAYIAIHELFQVKHLPLPFQYSSQDQKINGAYVFNYEQRKGLYTVESNTRKIKRIADSDSLIIIFPFASKTDSVARFVLSDYAEENSAFGIMFPTKLSVSITIQDHTILNLNSTSNMEHGFPVNSTTTISFSKFNIENHLKIRLSKSKGVIHQSINFRADERSILDLNSRLVASMSDTHQMLFTKMQLEGKVFPVRFVVDVDRNNFSADASKFVDEFNARSRIEVFQEKSDRKIGDVLLLDEAGRNRLNFAIRYSDGSASLLQDMLFGFDEIMNMKL